MKGDVMIGVEGTMLMCSEEGWNETEQVRQYCCLYFIWQSLTYQSMQRVKKTIVCCW